ncbi:MAG: SDR family oxidoreductase [Dehalococcoidia bacterium]|nr:MAG: SDR family oxidoreductase [Dehalococcoidia bacterium]
MKTVVTGGAGFIGSHLVDELVNRDHRVTIIDDLSSGKESNIARHLKEGKATLIIDSVTSLSRLESAFSGAKYVFHLAAIASVPKSLTDPRLTHEVNATGTLNVLLAARRSKVKKVVFASSAAVYGDTGEAPQHEDILPNPKSPYAVSKLAGEYYCTVFSQAYDLPTAVLRYYNVYGPRQDPNSEYSGVISKFLTSVLKNKPPEIFGDGEATRDFTFVKDAVRASLLAAESDANGVFNIGTGEKSSINDLAKLIIRLGGKKMKLAYRKPRSGDIRHSLADISRAAGFGYQPEYRFEEGLRETIEALTARETAGLQLGN